MSKNPEDFDMDLDEDLGNEESEDEPESEPVSPKSKTPAGGSSIASKTPQVSGPVAKGGKKINLFFSSTVGPGEKKQKLMVNTGNSVGAIKETIGNMFGLDPQDFHLSYGGVTMEESSPIMEYGVDDGDTVLLIPASTAG